MGTVVIQSSFFPASIPLRMLRTLPSGIESFEICFRIGKLSGVTSVLNIQYGREEKIEDSILCRFIMRRLSSTSEMSVDSPRCDINMHDSTLAFTKIPLPVTMSQSPFLRMSLLHSS